MQLPVQGPILVLGRCPPTSRQDRTTCRRSWARSGQAQPAPPARSGARGYYSSPLLTFLSLTGFVCATIWWGIGTVITLKWNRRWNHCAYKKQEQEVTPKRYGTRMLYVGRIGAAVCPYGINPSSLALATAWVRLCT